MIESRDYKQGGWLDEKANGPQVGPLHKGISVFPTLLGNFLSLFSHP